ncbi:MAG TPA: FHA domain-containing protein [Nevskia sp.]|nr:FHA domain-containing protein [Nevskia sp.]
MAKLIITDAEGATRDFPLTKERITIGRHPDNDISLNDKAVSGRHAVVITILHDSFLEDLNSTNGTMVNGKQVAKHPLANGDTVSIGRNTLKYLSEAAAGEEDDFEKTMILRPGQMGAAFESQVNKAAAAAPGQEAPSGGKPLVGKLKVASGPNMGKELELTKALTTIGRPGVQVAAITRRADGYYIVHVGGASGGQHPLVNGQEIDAQARKLSNGDTIDLVGTKMTFLLGA